MIHTITDEPVILTHTNTYVDLVNTDPQTIHIEDIAWGLSNVCRFSGHTNVPYTVAEHSCRVADLLRARGYSPRAQLAGLLHDAAEAYLGDVATPLKRLLPDYKALEKNLESVIELRFQVQWTNRPEVKEADMLLLAAEAYALLPVNLPWACLEGLDPTEYEYQMARAFNRQTVKWGNRSQPTLAGWFMHRFKELKKEAKL